MAPRNFKLTLTRLPRANPPDTEETIIRQAIEAARRHRIKARGGQVDPHKDHHREPKHSGDHNGKIVWHLHGEWEPNGRQLAERWRGGADSVDPHRFPAFPPTVRVDGPAEDP
jgi:hypothetical protein